MYSVPSLPWKSNLLSRRTLHELTDSGNSSLFPFEFNRRCKSCDAVLIAYHTYIHANNDYGFKKIPSNIYLCMYGYANHHYNMVSVVRLWHLSIEASTSGSRLLWLMWYKAALVLEQMFLCLTMGSMMWSMLSISFSSSPFIAAL